MNNLAIHLGNTILKQENTEITGQFIEIENEKFYKISNVNLMPDFFMTIVSDSDHWMFLSSNGSLTAGRKNRDNALFPYYTDDKIHDYKGLTGSKTIFLIEKTGKTFLWEPFTNESEKVYSIKRNLYKSIYGNKIIFEELNTDLGISFKYGWYNSEKFGWIKKSVVTNDSNTTVKVSFLDGIRNILPYGVDYQFQNEFSNLLDAYKKNELVESTRLGLFMLSSIPVDRAEPSEALKTTTAWSHGLNTKTKILLSDQQLENFKKGFEVESETDIRASRGAYYLHNELELEKGEKQNWFLVAEVNQDSADVASLAQFLKTQTNIEELVNKDILQGTSNLIQIVAKADGLQMGNEDLCYARHFSNTLFNIMRGGIFTKNYTVDVSDFFLFVDQTNKEIKTQFSSELAKLPKLIEYSELVNWAKELQNPELERICTEYFPLTFSRRHGDPSRPWNRFSIEIKNSDGTEKLSYQGNWRDIFQNWEALGISFPGYFEGMISKFVNASTADGYNPYRITREGIDWESPSPDDPWAYIGYWGDHQIIYLQKFLEHSESFHPGKLDELLTQEIFVYANVPYRIKPFEEMVKNPKATIDFDFRLNREIEKLTEKVGSDGRLLRNSNGEICHANFAEKILVTLLSKISNFIPDAGIWLNTQRPEWNDANNALVGNGVSMVTLYYLRRFISFWTDKLSASNLQQISIAEEIETQFEKTFSLFTENTALLKTGFSNTDRYHFAASLGKAGQDYRKNVYENSFSGKRSSVTIKTLVEFLQLANQYIDQSIQANKRDNGLYHAYNLVSFKEKNIVVRNLYEMLEGQVAVLSSGYLSATESLGVLDALKNSSLFRADQYSYVLYPDRQLPRFTEKNNIPDEHVKASPLLQKLATNKNASIIKQDANGHLHFNGTFRNAAVLEKALDNLNDENYKQLVEQEKETILNIFEEIFDHQSFTGRSGTFYGYEGLGSIYWHMVSKLLLATQECYFKAIKEGAGIETVSKLKQHYYEIKAGIGLYKSPGLYGAFPTDAYSHTPAKAGVKQPGLTGQVKEDVISRFGELGVMVQNGKISFNPSLLNQNELLQQTETFSYIDLEGNQQSIELSSSQIGFTFCQVPVIYTFGSKNNTSIIFKNGEIKHFGNNETDESASAAIFSRSGEVERIECQFSKKVMQQFQ
jgi:hypothetical protein